MTLVFHKVLERHDVVERPHVFSLRYSESGEEDFVGRGFLRKPFLDEYRVAGGFALRAFFALAEQGGVKMA